MTEHQNLLSSSAKGEKEGGAGGAMGRRYYSKENEEILNSIFHSASIKCSQCSVCPIQGKVYSPFSVTFDSTSDLSFHTCSFLFFPLLKVFGIFAL